MYTLYGSRGSGSAAIESALELIGLPYRSVRASTWEDDSAQADLCALNPLCQIPTLVRPAGAVLSESAAILITLGLEHPAALDMLAAVVSQGSGTCTHLRVQRPAFWATLQRVQAHPRLAAIFQRHWPD